MAKLWSKEDKDFLIEWYIEEPQLCAEVLDRSVSAVRSQAARLGLTQSLIWSFEEEKYLTDNYEMLGVEACAKVLNRSADSIKHKASKLKLKIYKPWDTKEDALLTAKYKTEGVSFCVDTLGRSRDSIISRAKRLELTSIGECEPWTAFELKYLKDNYPAKGGDYCAKYLNRSKMAIWAKASKLNLKVIVVEITKEDLIKELKAIAVNKRASIKLNDRLGKYSSNTYYNYFGSWTNALKEAELLPYSKGTSIAEEEIVTFIKSLYSGELWQSDRVILEGKELDIVLPELKLAFEFDGVYWHSENRGKDKEYHRAKTKLAASKGYTLIHIFSTDWEQKQGITKSRIRNLLGLSNRIYARKCYVAEVSTQLAKEFLDYNHLQGFVGASIKLGLFYKEDLVAIQTFSKARFTSKASWELIRFANKLNTSVVGGASKLFKHFIREWSPSSIVSYSDIRWGSGNLYNKLGMLYTHSSAPNYWYFKRPDKLESRHKYQKHKLSGILETFDPKLTEYENMVANGFNRIYDCGNNVFLWTR